MTRHRRNPSRVAFPLSVQYVKSIRSAYNVLQHLSLIFFVLVFRQQLSLTSLLLAFLFGFLSSLEAHKSLLCVYLMQPVLDISSEHHRSSSIPWIYFPPSPHCITGTMQLSHLLSFILPGAVMAITTGSLSQSTCKDSQHYSTIATTKPSTTMKSSTTAKSSTTSQLKCKDGHHCSSSTISTQTSTSSSITYTGGYYCSGTVSSAPPMFTSFEVLAVPCPDFEGTIDTVLTCCDPQVGNSTLREGC